jgi:hypothetical protein
MGLNDICHRELGADLLLGHLVHDVMSVKLQFVANRRTDSF